MLRSSRVLICSAAAFIISASPSFAQGAGVFDEQVRQALLRNPEIILEVFALLEDQQKAEAALSDQQIIEQYRGALFGEDVDANTSILVEFADYQCGYCRQSVPVVASILADNPEVTLRLIELPILGEKSREYAAKMLAIKALYGEETYLELHSLFLGGRGGALQNFDAVIYGATAAFGLAAAILPRVTQRSFPIMFGAMLISGLAPPPARPEYSGPPIFGISHRPDSVLKWSSTAYAAEMLDTLTTLSIDTAGSGLTVWPENAITSTFDLGEAVASLDPNLFPLLFGMTRFERAGSPELRNSAVLVTAEGVQVSDKERLVPVIETGAPFLDRSDLGTGTRNVLFLDDGTKILPLICYEATFLLSGSELAEHPDAFIILAAESGFAEGLADSIMRRHARARELETGIRVERVSDTVTY